MSLLVDDTRHERGRFRLDTALQKVLFNLRVKDSLVGSWTRRLTTFVTGF